jgi:Alkylmercury lyase
MLFFRDEEQVDGWCAAQGLPKRPLVSLAQLWTLSQAWYSNRLDPEVRRRSPEEVRRIFAGAGLEGAFWDPQSDRF